MPIHPDDLEFEKKKRINQYDQWKQYTDGVDKAEKEKKDGSIENKKKKVDTTISKLKGKILGG